MTILFNGCSFTWGTCVDQKQTYPWLVKNKLKMPMVMMAEPSKDNNRIIDETATYLINSKNKNTVDITHVVLQLTDNYRYQIFKREESGHIKPDNLASQVMNKRCFVKLCNWFWDKAYKIGTHVIVPSMAQNRRGDWIERFTLYNLGDTTDGLGNLRCLTRLNLLQNYCSMHGIKLTIINYYGFNEWCADTLYKALDKKDFLIENSNAGLFNHMLWLGFEQPDKFHFDAEAHAWQAEKVVEHILWGKQIVVREEIKDYNAVHRPAFDYNDMDL